LAGTVAVVEDAAVVVEVVLEVVTVGVIEGTLEVLLVGAGLLHEMRRNELTNRNAARKNKNLFIAMPPL
jgi:hypothetical protein